MTRPRLLLVLSLAMLVAMPAFAGDWSLGNGSIHFTTPDTWTTIMQGQGTPEIVVFRVPDASPTGQKTLARISVKVVPASSGNAFKGFVEAAHTHARELPGFKTAASGHERFAYTAQENGLTHVYRERFFRVDGHAVELSCIRPQKTEAGANWIRHFDAGCTHLAKQLQDAVQH